MRDSQVNYLVNSNFNVIQYGGGPFTSATTPANSDDTYLLDQWVLLSDGNDIVDVSHQTAVIPTIGSRCALKLEVETANKKFGMIQFLEHKDAQNLTNRPVSVSFQARNAAADDLTDVLKCAVLAWDSTQDVITSDVVSAWNADLTSPTLVANWTYENTPTNLTLTQTFQTFRIENISLDTASTANLAVFIWCDNADGAVDDAVYITDVKLEVGAQATQYYPPLFSADLAACQRYLWKTFPYETVPAQNVGTIIGTISYNVWVGSNITAGATGVDFPVVMRVTPTMTYYNPAGANTNWHNADRGADSGASTGGGTTSWRCLNVQNAQDVADLATQTCVIHAKAVAQL